MDISAKVTVNVYVNANANVNVNAKGYANVIVNGYVDHTVAVRFVDKDLNLSRLLLHFWMCFHFFPFKSYHK